MISPTQRRYVETARVGRLATADAEGRPHAVPVCFVLVGERIATPIDEKPQRVAPDQLQRSRNIAANPPVSLVIDHYTEDWSALGWVQIRGTARQVPPGEEGHGEAVAALRGKYDQYADQELESRPVIDIEPGSVRSWGHLERPAE